MENTQRQAEEEKQIPSKEEIIRLIKEQIEVKSAQVELQRLNTEFAQLRLEELKAMTIAAQITNPPGPSNAYQGGVPHKITEEDMENNPELKEQGLKVGDEILISMDNADAAEEQTAAPQGKRGLKKV